MMTMMIGCEVGPGLVANVLLSSSSRNIQLDRQAPRPGDHDCQDFVDDGHGATGDDEDDDNDGDDDYNDYQHQYQDCPFGDYHLPLFSPKTQG